MSENIEDLTVALEGIDALLPFAVYEKLFTVVAAEKPEHILEIGTAHGGATIAMALGAKSVGYECAINTVDLLQATPDIPSSRNRWGDVNANEAIVRKNFEAAGVADNINFFVGRSDEFAAAKTLTQKIDMLVLDADGRIDRDLLLFCRLLKDNAVVVIDDVGGGTKLSGVGEQKFIDLKHTITENLLSALTEKGFLREEQRVGITVFCRAVEPQKWDLEKLTRIALTAYRDIVFIEIANKDIWKIFGRSALKNSPVGRLLWPIFKKPIRMILGDR
jgi:hypothetical protein